MPFTASRTSTATSSSNDEKCGSNEFTASVRPPMSPLEALMGSPSRDQTTCTKDDAVVTVDSGGAAGIVALYVFSAGSGKDLKVVFRNQRLYRAMAHLNPGPSLVYSLPQWQDGDQLCCPSSYRETELKWSTKSKRFGIVRRRTIPATLITGD